MSNLGRLRNRENRVSRPKWEQADAHPVLAIMVRNRDVYRMLARGTFDEFWEALGRAERLLIQAREDGEGQ